MYFDEKYNKKGVHEITFDTWPDLPEYMEIDCTSFIINKTPIITFTNNTAATRTIDVAVFIGG